VIRRALFAGLLLGPLTVVLHYAADLGATAEFVLAAASLIPLAWLIGEATEHAAEHTGPGIGGFLNATFGNAPELIIALIAVNDAEVGLGSNRDRHAALGEGTIGDGMATFLAHAAFQDVAAILETPGADGTYVGELALLRALHEEGTGTKRRRRGRR
jgi:Ca2+:H+ antiporter